MWEINIYSANVKLSQRLHVCNVYENFTQI